MRGRKPKSVSELKLAGTYRADRHAGRGVQLPVEKPTLPKLLKGNAAAMAAWKDLVKQLERAGVLAKIDGTLLMVCCDAVSDFHEVVWQTRELKAELKDLDAPTELAPGQTEEQAEAKKERDRGKIENKLWRLGVRKGKVIERLIKIGDRFGLSPVARVRLSPAGETEQEEDPFEALLNQRGKRA